MTNCNIVIKLFCVFLAFKCFIVILYLDYSHSMLRPETRL